MIVSQTHADHIRKRIPRDNNENLDEFEGVDISDDMCSSNNPQPQTEVIVSKPADNELPLSEPTQKSDDSNTSSEKMNQLPLR